MLFKAQGKFKAMLKIGEGLYLIFFKAQGKFKAMLKIGGGIILIVVGIILGESLGTYRTVWWYGWWTPWGCIAWGVGFILWGLWRLAVGECDPLDGSPRYDWREWGTRRSPYDWVEGRPPYDWKPKPRDPDDPG